MDYANYSKIQSIVLKIQNYETKLLNLDNAENLTVVINEKYRHSELEMIPLYEACTNEFKAVAVGFITTVRCAINERITELKKELELL